MQIVDYNPATGEIIVVYSFQSLQSGGAGTLEAGLSRLTFSDGSQVSAGTHYIDNNQAALRAPLALYLGDDQTITANGQDEAVIDNIPAGVSVTWPDGQTDEVTDGDVRFSVDLPGTYRLKFTAVEYLDKEVTIEAVAAD